METISHREMRNRSGEILRRVEAGESFEVTNNGHTAAVIGPPRNNAVAEALRRGEARRPAADISTLRAIPRVALPISTREIIDDVRGPGG